MGAISSVRHCQAILVIALAGLLCSPVPGAWAQAHRYPADVANDLQQGSSLIHSQHYEEARKVFKNILTRVPRCSDAYEGLGLSYLMDGDNARAEQAFRGAIELDSFNVNVLDNLGTATYRQGKIDESITFYQQALNLARNNDHTIHANLANSYAEKGETEKALEQFSLAIKLKPDYAPAYSGLALLYYDQKRFDDAEREAKNAIKFKPDYAIAYYNLGLIEAAMKKIPEAREAFNNSLRFDTNGKYIADTKRILHQLELEGQSPGSASRTALVLPTGVSGSVSLTGTGTGSSTTAGSREEAMARANDLLRRRDWTGAQHELDDIVKRYGEDALTMNNLGYALAHQGAPACSAAIDAYNRAIALKNGPFPTAQYNLGQAYRLQNKNAQAERAFRLAIDQAKALRTSLPLAQNALGVLLKQKGDLAGADAAYRRALAQSGVELPVVHYNLGILLEHMERTREAVREYKAYLSLCPKGVNVKQVRSRLKRLGVEPPA